MSKFEINYLNDFYHYLKSYEIYVVRRYTNHGPWTEVNLLFPYVNEYVHKLILEALKFISGHVHVSLFYDYAANPKEIETVHYSCPTDLMDFLGGSQYFEDDRAFNHDEFSAAQLPEEIINIDEINHYRYEVDECLMLGCIRYFNMQEMRKSH